MDASLLEGVVATKCQKQKLNVKSLTEGEIVGVSDFMPNMIWVRMFIEVQGYRLEENTLFQDTTLMEGNQADRRLNIWTTGIFGSRTG